MHTLLCVDGMTRCSFLVAAIGIAVDRPKAMPLTRPATLLSLWSIHQQSAVVVKLASVDPMTDLVPVTTALILSINVGVNAQVKSSFWRKQMLCASRTSI